MTAMHWLVFVADREADWLHEIVTIAGVEIPRRKSIVLLQ